MVNLKKTICLHLFQPNIDYFRNLYLEGMEEHEYSFHLSTIQLKQIDLTKLKKYKLFYSIKFYALFETFFGLKINKYNKFELLIKCFY